MSDHIDDANDTADFLLQLSLKRKLATTAPATGTGHCLHCDAAITGARRWCDAACRDDYEAEQKRIKREGDSSSD